MAETRDVTEERPRSLARVSLSRGARAHVRGARRTRGNLGQENQVSKS